MKLARNLLSVFLAVVTSALLLLPFQQGFGFFNLSAKFIATVSPRRIVGFTATKVLSDREPQTFNPYHGKCLQKPTLVHNGGHAISFSFNRENKPRKITSKTDRITINFLMFHALYS